MRREPAAQTVPVLAIGVDGCPAGWFFVELQPSGITRCGVVRTLQELVRDAREPARVYVTRLRSTKRYGVTSPTMDPAQSEEAGKLTTFRGDNSGGRR